MANDLMVSASAAFTEAQLKIIKRSVAPDTNNDEFDLFVETCKLYGLNPMKRQIGARVYSKDDAAKRKMAIITEIGGLRAIAARQGDYRPDDDEPDFQIDPTKTGPTNPLGLVRAKVSCFKLDKHGNWNRCIGVAYWDEIAPITEDAEGGYDWVETGEVWPDTKKPKKKKVPRGNVILQVDPKSNWGKMPRLMLAKVAEAQALRKGWPEDLSGIYEAAETDRADVEHTASEVLEQAAADDRLKKLGSPKNGYAIQWAIGEPLEIIAPGVLHDRAEAWARHDERSGFDIKMFLATNSESLRRFWADLPGDAMELKKLLERRERELTAVAETAQ